MTNKPTRAIGERIARYRREAGFRTVEALVEAIGNPLVTTSTVQNIEAGRKADVSVTYLLEIARAVRVPPVLLLADMERPLSPVDLPNLGPQFAGLQAWKFDDWFSGTGNPTAGDLGGIDGLEHRLLLEYTRRLMIELNQWQADDELMHSPQANEHIALRQTQRQERIDRLLKSVGKRSADLGWVSRPWAEPS